MDPNIEIQGYHVCLTNSLATLYAEGREIEPLSGHYFLSIFCSSFQVGTGVLVKRGLVSGYFWLACCLRDDVEATKLQSDF
jgi:hypothetical protein